MIDAPQLCADVTPGVSKKGRQLPCAVVPTEPGHSGVSRMLSGEHGDVGDTGHGWKDRGHNMAAAGVPKRCQLGYVTGRDGCVQRIRPQAVGYQNDDRWFVHADVVEGKDVQPDNTLR